MLRPVEPPSLDDLKIAVNTLEWILTADRDELDQLLNGTYVNLVIRRARDAVTMLRDREAAAIGAAIPPPEGR